jgi:ABC-type multidrug transport system fused ATPase/permease subunit
MVSVERIVNYSELESEETAHGSHRGRPPPSDWPVNGTIEFRNVSLNYGEEQGHEALKDITVLIRSKEKVKMVYFTDVLCID